MNMIASFKTWPLLAALVTGFTLAPTLSMAGNNNERDKHAQQRADQHNAQQRGQRNGHRNDQRNGRHPEQRHDQRHEQRGDQHRPNVNHYNANRSHPGHGHHPGRDQYRDRHHPHINHHYDRHGHRHTIVHNSYRRPIYVPAYPRLMIGLHSDNVDIIFRDR